MPVLVEGVVVPAGFAVTTQEVGASTPQAVQVIVTGMDAGDTYTVTGSAAGFNWQVRGGSGVSDGGQLLLTDLHTPVNVPITYTVTAGSASATSDPVTVDYDGRHALQSLDGRTTVVGFVLLSEAPLSHNLRQARYAIPGRSSPVIRYDVSAGMSGSLSFYTGQPNTPTMRELVSTGAPVVLRTDGSLYDLPAVMFMALSGVSSGLLGETDDGWAREWSLTFDLIDDPEPDTVASVSTWADLYAAYEGLTWQDFYDEFADGTWADVYRTDWASRAGS